jgi:lipopolysaccharide transport system permease protein
MSAGSRGPTAEPTPTTVITARRGLAAPDLREPWAYRELGFFFVWRDIKVRYRQTVFGVLWAVLQPVALMVVFSLFLGRLAGIAPTDVAYPLFVFTALVPWTLFSRCVVGASESLVNASSLIQKVYFPRLLLPLAALGSHVLDFLIASALLGALALSFGITPSITVLAAVPLTLLTLVIALGIGVWLAAANVRYRDIRHTVPLLIQVWLFASPVAYSSQVVTPELSWLYHLNPMVVVLEGFRWAVLGGMPPSADAFLISLTVAIVTLASGLFYFDRVERGFADVI